MATSGGEIPAELAVVATHKRPNVALAAAAGLRTGSTGGLIVDERMATSAPHVWAAGDACEIPHGLTRTPLQGLTGSHAYAQGKAAGANAGGGDRAYRAVFVPWGTPAGKWVIGGASFGEATALALGIPYVLGVAETSAPARYYPGPKRFRVKLLAEPGSLRLIGGQMVGGGEGIKERADFLAQCIRFGLTLPELADMDTVYAPEIGALDEPIAAAAADGVAAAARKARLSDATPSPTAFFGWLRRNSEHYLLVAAHRRLARTQRRPAAAGAEGAGRERSGCGSSPRSTRRCRGRCAAGSCGPCRAATAGRGRPPPRPQGPAV